MVFYLFINFGEYNQKEILIFLSFPITYLILDFLDGRFNFRDIKNHLKNITLLAITIAIVFLNFAGMLHPSYSGSAIFLIALFSSNPLVHLASIFLLTNKTSALALSFYILFSRRLDRPYFDLFIRILFFQITLIFLWYQTSFWFYESSINNIHTINHRLNVIQLYFDYFLSADYDVIKLIIPFQGQALTDQAFDNGYILAFARYGHILGLIFFIKIFKIFYNIAGYPAVIGASIIFLSQPFLLHPYSFSFFIILILIFKFK